MAQSFAETILKAADPRADLSGLSAAEKTAEAEAVALTVVEDWRMRQRRQESAPSWLSDAQRIVWAALKEAASISPWSTAEAQYQPRSPQSSTQCARCAFLAGGECQILSSSVQPAGTCRLHLVPPAEAVPEVEAPLSAIRTDGKVQRYQGLDIGIQVEPGEKRFSMGVPMRAFYGHVRRSYGSAPDGRALDVYLAQEFDPNLSYPIFKVQQRNPTTGEPDEPKYMIGYTDVDEARENYVYHAGRDRLGTIAQIDGSELDPYRNTAREDGYLAVLVDKGASESLTESSNDD